ncbi:MAG TPA: alpha/beta hydrolase [Cytophagales bacterium]|nr:alpha/beta hydrolase [Cytophagales bacterium]
MTEPYQNPWFLFNNHLETIYPALFRKVELNPFQPERIATPDNDFLDLFHLRGGNNKCVILSHGLEGNAHRAYIKGMAKVFYRNNFDVVAWNYRGCGEEMNKRLRFYHSGATEDLAVVVDHTLPKYDELYLIGFSLGGNLTLKYVGEREVNPKMRGVAVFSVPMDLYRSCLKISEPSNWVYSNRFLKSLKKKVVMKSQQMDGLAISEIENINTLKDFDDSYTGPLHGFKDAIDYYTQNSSIFFLDKIKIPTLIVNAKNDPFLSKECFPQVSNPLIQTEYPDRGGHVGFISFNGNGLYWSEQRALDFILSL